MKTSEKVNRWLQLNTSEEEVLAKQNIVYDKVLKKYKANKSREAHLYGDKLREVMRTKIMPSQEFTLLSSGFTHQVKIINSIECTAL